jgi:hypothetical protein
MYMYHVYQISCTGNARPKNNNEFQQRTPIGTKFRQFEKKEKNRYITGNVS